MSHSLGDLLNQQMWVDGVPVQRGAVTLAQWADSLSILSGALLTAHTEATRERPGHAIIRSLSDQIAGNARKGVSVSRKDILTLLELLPEKITKAVTPATPEGPCSPADPNAGSRPS